MKYRYVKLLVVAAALLGLQAPASAQPRRITRAQATAFKRVVDDAKGRVGRLIAIGRGHTHLNEDDILALDRLTQASGALDSARVHVDAMLKATEPTAPDPDAATYHFALACTDSAIALSRVSRARLAARQPPAGMLGAFATDFDPIVEELGQLRGDPVNCPTH